MSSERKVANDGCAFEEHVIDLYQVDGFRTTLYFQQPILSAYGVTVVSVDVRDVNSLIPSNQAIWILRCEQLGNSSMLSHRVNGMLTSNVIKMFSRNQLISRFPIPMGLTQIFQEQNINRLDFSLRNSDGNAIDVNPSTVAIQVVIEILKKRFM